MTSLTSTTYIREELLKALGSKAKWLLESAERIERGHPPNSSGEDQDALCINALSGQLYTLMVLEKEKGGEQ
jgi:hypothetical protein